MGTGSVYDTNLFHTIENFGLGEFAECAYLGVDVVDEVKQTNIQIRYFHSLLHRLDHGFDELLFGLGDAVFGVELGVDFGNWARPADKTPMTIYHTITSCLL